MNPENRKHASNLAKRAGKQSKYAAQNMGKAAQVAAQPVLEEVQDIVETVEDVTEEAVNTAKRVNPFALSRLSSNTGQGFLALSVALYASGFAFSKFRGVYTGRSHVLNSPVKISE